MTCERTINIELAAKEENLEAELGEGKRKSERGTRKMKFNDELREFVSSGDDGESTSY